MKRHIIIPIFVPHQGCPHDCSFCNQKKISGAQHSFDSLEVSQQIESYLSSAEGVDHIEIAFFGGSFTGIPMDAMRSYLDLATTYIHSHHLHGIRLSTRPDMISTDILDLLSQYPVKAIELGVQSMSDEVLIASTRGHSSKDVINASKLIKSYGFELGLQMMLGLPKDTPETSLYTCDQIINLEPDMVRIYPTLVIKDTALEKMYLEGSYAPFDLDTTVNLCVTLQNRFEAAGIKVLRIGLQTTEQIQHGKDIIAGPHHPALRQLVEEKRWVQYILDFVSTLDASIQIEANTKLYQTLVGHKKSHLPLWAEHSPVITIGQNNNLPPNVLKINETYHKGHRQINFQFLSKNQ